jgi:hypothetical protein
MNENNQLDILLAFSAKKGIMRLHIRLKNHAYNGRLCKNAENFASS